MRRLNNDRPLWIFKVTTRIDLPCAGFSPPDGFIEAPPRIARTRSLRARVPFLAPQRFPALDFPDHPDKLVFDTHPHHDFPDERREGRIRNDAPLPAQEYFVAAGLRHDLVTALEET